jgi:hypothetical protein
MMPISTCHVSTPSFIYKWLFLKCINTKSDILQVFKLNVFAKIDGEP